MGEALQGSYFIPDQRGSGPDGGSHEQRLTPSEHFRAFLNMHGIGVSSVGEERRPDIAGWALTHIDEQIASGQRAGVTIEVELAYQREREQLGIGQIQSQSVRLALGRYYRAYPPEIAGTRQEQAIQAYLDHLRGHATHSAQLAHLFRLQPEVKARGWEVASKSLVELAAAFGREFGGRDYYPLD